VLASSFTVKAILDKGIGAAVVLDVDTWVKDTGEKVAKNQVNCLNKVKLCIAGKIWFLEFKSIDNLNNTYI